MIAGSKQKEPHMFGRFVAAVLALSVATAPVAASEDGPQKGQFFVSGLGYWLGLPDEQGYSGSALGGGAALGWSFHDDWAAEVSFLRTNEADFELSGGGKRSETVDNVWFSILYLVPSELSFQPYVAFGAGEGRYDRGSDGQRDINEYNLGVGAFKNFNERVSMRGDVRALYLDHDDDDLVPVATLGVSVLLGAVAKAAPVADSDGDGVPDSRDRCPGTPPGRRVDADGCEFDSDGDGVVDGDDACPGTPPGVKVDSRGCPLPVPAPVTEPVRFDLTVEFAFDSAEINDLSFRELRRAMQFLRDHPETKAVIEGHTDSRGSEEYNQSLSERRAAAVVGVLVNSGIEAGRLRSEGFGESRPVATNDTEEGRQRNRRVSIVVSPK
jgi:OOP family OmpA-OmpF porin